MRLSLPLLCSIAVIGFAVVPAFGACPPPCAPTGDCTIFVDDSADPDGSGCCFQSALDNLQDALAVATSSSVICIAAGEYRPDEGHGHTNNDQTETFLLVHGAKIFGGFQGTFQEVSPDNRPPFSEETDEEDQTILTGEIQNDSNPVNNSDHVVTAPLAPGATYGLDRVTIRGGHAIDDIGAGIVHRDGTLTIVDSILRDSETGWGAGIATVGEYADLVVRGTRFIGNDVKHQGGGIYVSECATANLLNCRFSMNSAEEGGGGFCTEKFTDNVLEGCMFYWNTAGVDGGGAILLRNPHTVEVTNCTIAENSTTRPGPYSCNPEEVEGCECIGNPPMCTASSDPGGGGIHNYSDPCSNDECNNEGICQIGVRNSIAWGNTDGTLLNPVYDDNILDSLTAFTFINNCDVEGLLAPDGPNLPPGSGNIEALPDFLDPFPPGASDESERRYRIDSESPCLDAGNNNYVAADFTLDLDRDDRIQHVIVDMGANEVQAGACCFDNTCADLFESECAQPYICDVNALRTNSPVYGNCSDDVHPGYNGCCYGDADGNGFVTPSDRGFVGANIGQTAFELLCLFDMDGNGFITPGDRGFVAANIGLCTPLPDFMNASGCNNGVCPDWRFVGEHFGEGTSCENPPCGTQGMMAGGGGSGESSASAAPSAGGAGMALPEGGESAALAEEPTGGEAGMSLSLTPSAGGGYELRANTALPGVTGYALFAVSASSSTAPCIASAAGGSGWDGSGAFIATPLGAGGNVLPAPGYPDGWERRYMVTDELTGNCTDVSDVLCTITLDSCGTLNIQAYVWWIDPATGALEEVAAQAMFTPDGM